MPQVTQVLSPVVQATPAAGTSSGSAETPDSGQSFESALAGHRLPDEIPARDIRPVKAARPDAPPDGDASVAAELAASGNLLPPVLPPVSVDPAVLFAEAPLVTGASSALVDMLAVELQDFSVTPEGSADVPAVVAGIPVSVQPPVVLPATDGRFFSTTGESFLNRPVFPGSAAADAQTLASLAAEAATATPSLKAPEIAAAFDGFRVVLKEIAPAVADARPIPASLLSASGLLPTSGFAYAPVSAPAGVPMPGASISVPFGQAGWGQAFSNQVVWAVNQGMPAAELHLSPPDLGPMSVRISMDQDQASITFSSSHAMVREAIEAALPRLRDLLGSQGITLADVSVSQHQSSQAQRDPGGNGHAAVSGHAADGESEVAAQAAQNRPIGVLDLYA